MKRNVIILLACVFAFPTVTRTALIQTELSYNVRNAKGVYPFGTYLGGVGQVNMANGNLVFSRQLVARPGRAGFSADISLVCGVQLQLCCCPFRRLLFLYVLQFTLPHAGLRNSA